MSVLFLHYEMSPEVLQPHVPFTLDDRDGKAYVSLVAVEQENLQFEFGGCISKWVGHLAANHPFLNLRTYVGVGNEQGIYFLSEWVSNRLAASIAPRMFGLPYRLGKLRYEHQIENGILTGAVSDATGNFRYQGTCQSELQVSEEGSVDQFVLERYIAFTEWNGLKKYFRVSHEPWMQTHVTIDVTEDSLLSNSFSWWSSARYVSANFSPGVDTVRISKPCRIDSQIKSGEKRCMSV